MTTATTSRLDATSGSALAAVRATREYLRTRGVYRDDLDRALEAAAAGLTTPNPGQDPLPLAFAVAVLRTARTHIRQTGPDPDREAVADRLGEFADACRPALTEGTR